MTHKSPRVRELVEGCHHPVWDVRYVGYYACFHRQLYYEAHDVLEDLWLEEGRTGTHYAAYKGLIQLAGAFVHMKLHFEAPEHRVHGGRLHPAERLLRLAISNLGGYSCPFQGLDVSATIDLAQEYVAHLRAGNFARNPWTPESPPQLPWDPERV